MVDIVGPRISPIRLKRQADRSQRCAKLTAKIAHVVLLVERDNVAWQLVWLLPHIIIFNLNGVVAHEVESLPAESSGWPNFDGQVESPVCPQEFHPKVDHLTFDPPLVRQSQVGVTPVGIGGTV